jgi:hypothetical protein
MHQGNPIHFLPSLATGLGGLMEAALGCADLLDDIAEADEAIGIKLTPVAEDAHDVRPGRRLDGGRDARLDVVLMVSRLSLRPRSFSDCLLMALRRTWSEAGTKSVQRSQ